MDIIPTIILCIWFAWCLAGFYHWVFQKVPQATIERWFVSMLFIGFLCFGLIGVLSPRTFFK
jgi:hypothetical protein